eukprot:362555-Chlamydomonas_euryale.AAC.12
MHLSAQPSFICNSPLVEVRSRGVDSPTVAPWPEASQPIWILGVGLTICSTPREHVHPFARTTALETECHPDYTSKFWRAVRYHCAVHYCSPTDDLKIAFPAPASFG